MSELRFCVTGCKKHRQVQLAGGGRNGLEPDHHHAFVRGVPFVSGFLDRVRLPFGVRVVLS